MKTYGLVGKTLSHSFSPNYFSEKFKKNKLKDVSYQLFELDRIEKVIELLQTPINLCGFNVTVPYKESIIPYLDKLDESAVAVGAVNCVRVIRNSKKHSLVGYNTDVFGFSHALKPFLASQHQQALILGTGGSSKAVQYVLRNLGIDCFLVSRSNPDNKNNTLQYEELNENVIQRCKLIVNTTPVGMYPDNDTFPNLPYQYIGKDHLVFDLVYNPLETELLKKAKANGALVQNGLSMLYLQAEKAWEIWNL